MRCRRPTPAAPLAHNWRVWAIALGAPLAVTALGLFVDDRRIGFPVLLYLLGVVAAIPVGRIAAGVVAGVASGIGLAILLSAQDSLKSQDDVKSVLSVFLVVLVALVLAYAISSMQWSPPSTRKTPSTICAC